MIIIGLTLFYAGDDLVPRLSYGSMEELKGHILIILEQEKSTIGRFFQIIAAGNTLGMSMPASCEHRCINVKSVAVKAKLLPKSSRTS